MADEIVILVVRDSGGQTRDLAELVDAGSNLYALRVHDTKNNPVFAAIRDRLKVGDVVATDSKLEAVRELLDTIKTNTDQLEGFTDGIEGLLTTIGAQTDQLEGYTDQLETTFGTAADDASAAGSLHAKLRQIAGNTDQLEGFVDGVESLLTDIRGYVDQLEGFVDSLEGVFGTAAEAASATGSVHAKLRQIAGNTGQSEDETRLDYDTRDDANPVYVGKNVQGTATSANSWIVNKFEYDLTNRLTRAQVKTGSWDGRAALF